MEPSITQTVQGSKGRELQRITTEFYVKLEEVKQTIDDYRTKRQQGGASAAELHGLKKKYGGLTEELKSKVKEHHSLDNGSDSRTYLLKYAFWTSTGSTHRPSLEEAYTLCPASSPDKEGLCRLLAVQLLNEANVAKDAETKRKIFENKSLGLLTLAGEQPPTYLHYALMALEQQNWITAVQALQKAYQLGEVGDDVVDTLAFAAHQYYEHWGMETPLADLPEPVAVRLAALMQMEENPAGTLPRLEFLLKNHCPTPESQRQFQQYIDNINSFLQVTEKNQQKKTIEKLIGERKWEEALQQVQVYREKFGSDAGGDDAERNSAENDDATRNTGIDTVGPEAESGEISKEFQDTLEKKVARQFCQQGLSNADNAYRAGRKDEEAQKNTEAYSEVYHLSSGRGSAPPAEKISITDESCAHLLTMMLLTSYAQGGLTAMVNVANEYKIELTRNRTPANRLIWAYWTFKTGYNPERIFPIPELKQFSFEDESLHEMQEEILRYFHPLRRAKRWLAEIKW